MSYETHPQLADIEDPDIVLWRYVGLCKWLDMLQTSELHLDGEAEFRFNV